GLPTWPLSAPACCPLPTAGGVLLCAGRALGVLGLWLLQGLGPRARGPLSYGCSRRGVISSACPQRLCGCAAPPSRERRHSREWFAGQRFPSPPLPAP